MALLSKHAIIIADKKLANSCTVHETIRVKVCQILCGTCNGEWLLLLSLRMSDTAKTF